MQQGLAWGARIGPAGVTIELIRLRRSV